jgi:type IV pilus assembly protein PilQ
LSVRQSKHRLQTVAILLSVLVTLCAGAASDPNDSLYPDANDVQPVVQADLDPNEPSEPNDPNALVVSAGGDIQSLTFMKNMDICDALLLLSAKYRRNIVPSPDVQGKLAFVNLYDVTFEEAMQAILGTDFKYEEDGNLVKVYPKNKGRMIHKIFTLYYIKAAEAKTLVQQVLSPEAKIEVTSAAEIGVPTDTAIGGKPTGGDTTAMNDTLIVCDYPENIDRAQEVIRVIDVHPKQVLVEATVLSATLTEGMQLGIDWQTIEGSPVGQLTDLSSGDPDYFRLQGTSASITGGSISGGITVGVVHGDIAAFIRAVEQVTDVTVLANPKILAVNKQLGQIYIGKKIAYQSQTTQTETSTTEQVEFLETGTKLSFRPYVGNDGLIRMDIHPKDSSATLRTSGTSTLPDETSAELATNILVKDGQTILIGGLFRDKISTTRTQVPVLGDLPLLGLLFRGKAEEVNREEVIVLLTPHVIDDPDQMAGPEQADDALRKIAGARRELDQANVIRQARDYYDMAVRHYIEGDNDTAIRELAAALRCHPNYLEAMRLKEMIEKEQRVKSLQAGK